MTPVHLPRPITFHICLGALTRSLSVLPAYGALRRLGSACRRAHRTGFQQSLEDGDVDFDDNAKVFYGIVNGANGFDGVVTSNEDLKKYWNPLASKSNYEIFSTAKDAYNFVQSVVEKRKKEAPEREGEGNDGDDATPTKRDD